MRKSLWFGKKNWSTDFVKRHPIIFVDWLSKFVTIVGVILCWRWQLKKTHSFLIGSFDFNNLNKFIYDLNGSFFSHFRFLFDCFVWHIRNMIENGNLYCLCLSITDFTSIGVIQVVKIICWHRLIGNDYELCFRYKIQRSLDFFTFNFVDTFKEVANAIKCLT